MVVGKNPNLTLLSTVANTSRTLHFGVTPSSTGSLPKGQVRFLISYVKLS
jgi:hypothetical protein